MAPTKRTAAVQPTDWGPIIFYGVIAAALTVLGLIIVDMALPRGGASTGYQNLVPPAGGGDAYAGDDANDGPYDGDPESEASLLGKVKDRRLMDQAASRLWRPSRNDLNGAAVPFVILHTAGEGSHGIADLAGSFVGANVHKGEPFEMRNYNQIGAAKAKIMQAFYRTGLPAGTAIGAQPIRNAIKAVFPPEGGEAGLNHIMGGLRGFRAPNGTNGTTGGCEARGTLFYAAVGHASLVCSQQLEPMLTVRGDLMRWSISTYADRVKSFGPAHPQFEPEAVKKGILGRIEIGKLAEIAWTLVARWKETVWIAHTLSDCGKPPLILFYEEFADQPESVRAQIRVFLQRRSKNAGCEFAPEETFSTHVRKAHSNRIADFVENAAEVIHHFEVTPYPTFAQIFFQGAG